MNLNMISFVDSRRVDTSDHALLNVGVPLELTSI
jgi:hypothetical protein